ncbi:MAG: DUF6089 family protein [Prolixibacteraceae bacterium]
MKRLLITFSIVLCFLQAFPQKSADVGIRIGAAVYWGDLENVSYEKEITALYGVLGRWNFNKRMSIRGQLISGTLKSSGTFPGVNLAEPSTKISLVDVNGIPYELYLKKSDDSYNFDRSMQSFEAIFEFNFMDYKMGSITRDRFTPFLSLGVGGFYSRAPRRGTLVLMPQVEDYPFVPYQGLYRPLLDNSNNKTNDADALAPIIPMGFGIKYNLTKRLGACVELCVRKTFTDNIDNLKDPKRFQNADPLMNAYPSSFSNNFLVKNDWYASLHLSLHWQVWTDKGICKVSDKKVKKSAF